MIFHLIALGSTFFYCIQVLCVYSDKGYSFTVVHIDMTVRFLMGGHSRKVPY